MIVLSAHTRVASSDSATDAVVSLSTDGPPCPSSHEALNTILLTGPGSPSMWLFK